MTAAASRKPPDQGRTGRDGGRGGGVGRTRGDSARTGRGNARTGKGNARDTARNTAERAEDSKTLDRLTRVGLLAYGVTHLLIAWLAVRIALGTAPAEGDQSGAFHVVAGSPVGVGLLVIIAVGLAAMAAWQVLVAAVGYRSLHGTRRTVERIGAGCRTVIYGALAVSAARIAFGGGQSTAGKQQQATSSVLGVPGGRWWIGLAGLIVIGFGVGLAIFGLLRKFEDQLKTGEMSATTRRTVRWLGLVGYAAKGVAYAIVGVLLVSAAVTYDASKSRGLDAALHTLAAHPWGRVLLIVIAIGIAAFGAYSLGQARYRKV